ncbi:acyltransferase [Neobacillus drentensis]|uniref:acyltransferase n=1 Tax=Neobacillus drentensis TaxID=220684 RepID=UPI002FFE7FDD
MRLKYYFERLFYRNPVDYAKYIGVKVGNGCRFSALPDFGSEPFLIEIGDHVLIGKGCAFVTHDSGNWLFREQEKYKKTMKFARVKVGNNCYIGIRSIIMPGVTIGDGCIIGAGSIVTNDIPEGSVAVGVPARVIKSVDEYAEKLLSQMPEYDERLMKQDRTKAILDFVEKFEEKNENNTSN